jgi:hypothetical protein
LLSTVREAVRGKVSKVMKQSLALLAVFVLFRKYSRFPV